MFKKIFKKYTLLINSMSDNSKKILCFNMIKNHNCNYNNKCLYAHSLKDQKLEPLREKVYNIIKSTDNLSNLDLLADNELYKTLILFTKICQQCNKNECPGGYNCRNGVINAAHKICYNDLVYGNCKQSDCNAIHLSNRGLIPYVKQKNNKLDQKDNKNIYDKNLKQITKKKINTIQGILLTDEFIRRHFGPHDENNGASDTSESEEDVEEIIRYLNNSDSCDDNDGTD